ncbi:alpha/beta fold hydrolase [Actinokineospora soli]|uniref:Alpha/beta fold hydrolase n=1 Tax=Actinokineospora soli TaxID=1048753 RepID=A0ABW2TP83_9PSEU
MSFADWIRVPRPRPYATRRLVCFPPAGFGAGFYRPWPDLLPADVELWAVQYPGREDRFTEPCRTELTAVAAEVAAALAGAGPVSLFGHSMGASIAYETARRLPLARALVVSGRPAPSHQRATRTTRYLDDDAAVVAELDLLGGSQPDAFADPELRALLLPVVRADFELIETYCPPPAPPLDLPVLALCGSADPRMTPAQSADWREATTGRFTAHALTGGHFFLTDHLPEVVRLVLDHTTTKETDMPVPAELTVDGVRASIAALLGVDVDSVGAQDNLLLLGVDSIKLMALAGQWQRLGVEVPFLELAEDPTAEGWARLLAATAGQTG